MKQDPGRFEFKARISTMFMREDSPCVYFIQDGEEGPVKIGLATCSSLELRITSLQIGNPRVLRFVGVVCLQGGRHIGYREEQRLHQHFQAFNIRGEWFEMCDSLRALVDEFSYEKYGGQLREFLRSAIIAAQAG
jgi:hypothetical protein